jgi:hypothetical protein
VDAIMGHADESMAAQYREEIGDDRLQAVVAHVRNWLFGTAAGELQRDHGKTAPGKNTCGKLTTSDARDAAGATRGDSEARRRLLEVWGQDDRDDRPQLRVVNGE